MSDNFKYPIFYKKTESGKRMPYLRLTVDSDMVLHNLEYLHVGSTVQMGDMQLEITEDGAYKLIGNQKEVGEKLMSQQNLMERFLNKDEPAWFKGCEELRKEYYDAVDAAQGKPGCSSCTLNAIKRKYFKKVQEAIKLDQEAGTVS